MSDNAEVRKIRAARLRALCGETADKPENAAVSAERGARGDAQGIEDAPRANLSVEDVGQLKIAINGVKVAVGDLASGFRAMGFGPVSPEVAAIRREIDDAVQETRAHSRTLLDWLTRTMMSDPNRVAPERSDVIMAVVKSQMSSAARALKSNRTADLAELGAIRAEVLAALAQARAAY